MIHFFPTFSKDASQSPFAHELRALGVAHRLFSGEIILRYRSRLWLVLRGWPKVLGFALQSALRSLVISRPHPDTVVVNSHIEALIFGLVRALFTRSKPRIVLLGFIYTRRSHALVNRLRAAYFRRVFSVVDQVICHSTLEVERYRALFPGCRAQFVFIPYGLHIHGHDTPVTATTPPSPYLLSAGRSGRDYATLFEAVAPLAVELHVVCDNAAALAGLTIPPNVRVLRACYDGDYVRELRHARAVVIPLGVDDISAGQMVLIQAMAYAKPTIVTRSPTTEEYATDELTSLLVAPRDCEGLRRAICRILEDDGLAARLSANARAAYEAKFCMRAFVRHLVGAVEGRGDETLERLERAKGIEPSS